MPTSQRATLPSNETTIALPQTLESVLGRERVWGKASRHGARGLLAAATTQPQCRRSPSIADHEIHRKRGTSFGLPRCVGADESSAPSSRCR
jgi:hypothetical protein